MSGQDANPILISLREAYVPSKQRDLKVSRRNVLSDSRPASYSRSGASTATAVTDVPRGNPAGTDEAGKLEELRVLLVLVKEHGECISCLEEQLGRMENGEWDLLPTLPPSPPTHPP